MLASPDMPPRTVVVSALGVAQILAWGSSYYLIAVLANPIAADTHWPMQWIVGGLSLGLLISGLVSPKVGALIEVRGGRPVLATSAVLLATGLLVIGLAPTLPVFAAGWAMLGLAMGAGLYDPAFAALGRLYGEQARPAIVQVTLYGGFASTVCWPLSAFLVEHVGWRGTCLSYAAVAMVVVLPLYFFGLPREAAHPPASAGPLAARTSVPGRRFALVTFAAIMTLGSVITTVVSVHLLTLLQARGLGLAQAVGLGALFGPAQVGARVLEAAFGRHHHPIWTLVMSSAGVMAGLAMLVGDPAMIAAGIVLFGAGNGLRSIARGTVPLALFGRDGYAALMGVLAMPSLVAQAAAPAIGALLILHLGASGTMASLCVAAMVVIALTFILLVAARR
jgi:predicted MFS family arabinose efflux permease